MISHSGSGEGIMTTGNHMTIGEFIELLLSEEITIERLKKFGNKLDEFSQKYASTRVDVGYNTDIQIEMDRLIGFLQWGLPASIENGSVDFLWDGEPRNFLQSFLEDISQDSLAFIITYATREEIKQALESEYR
jgi:hypothetical protein